MGTIKLQAGTTIGATWTTVDGGSGSPHNYTYGLASVNSIIVSSGPLDNSSNLDLWMDLSISLASVTPGAGTPSLSWALLPLNQDGTTYGPGTITTTAGTNGLPSECFVGSITLAPSTAGALTGMVTRVKLPFGQFAIAIFNGSGVTLASSAQVIKYRTYSLQD